MGFLSLATLLYIGIAYTAFLFIQSYLSERRFRRFALENGCQDLPRNQGKLPWSIDLLWRLMNAEKRGLDILDDIFIPTHKRLGPTYATVALFGQHMVTTVEPENIKAVLATKFKDFATGERRAKQFGALLGKNIFTSDGAYWAHSRALFRPQFSREQINDLEATEKAVQALFRAIPVNDETGWTDVQDILPLFFRFTLDTVTEFLFGASVNSQLAALPGTENEITITEATRLATEKSGDDVDFAEALDTASRWLNIRIRLQALYWLANPKKFRKSVAYIRRFTDYFVQMALDRHSKKEAVLESGEKKKYNLIESLTEDTQDPIEIRDQLLGLLAAGRDTTAGLLSWLFLVLATHPRVFAKLRQAVIDSFGETLSPTKPIDFATLKGCSYLQHCLLETLRVHTVVPFNNRVAVNDTVLPIGGGPDGRSPVAVRKGTLVNFNPYAVHRREDLWGPDADQFRPERWEGRVRGWDFVAFGGGPRVCIGQQFATIEASYLTVRLLQQFDAIEGFGMEGKIEKNLGLSMNPKQGVKVRLRKAGA